MAGETYFVRSRGKVTGPFDLGGLQRLVKLGMLSRVHEVSTDKQNWVSAATVPGVLQEAALRAPTVCQSDPGSVDEPANTYDITEPPRTGEQPTRSSEAAPQLASFNGPMVACVSCGSVLPAAQLFNDRGRYICPSCYQRLVPGVPPVRQHRADGGQPAGYFGSGVASLILGIAGIIIPTAGPLCLFLAINVARDMAVVFWGILLAGLACAIAATVFGSVTLRGNRKAKSRDGNGLAITGLILGIISLSGYAMWFVYLVIIFAAAALKAAAAASAAAAKAAAIKAAKAKAAALKAAHHTH